MSKSRIILLASGVTAVAVLSGIGWGWLASQVPQVSKADRLEALRQEPGSKVAAETAIQIAPQVSVESTGRVSNLGFTPDPNNIADWQDPFEKTLSSESEEPERSRQLLEVFPNLPQDAQVEAVEQLSNLLPNQEYAALAQYLTNSTIAEPVLDVIMAGLLNRPDTLKLPYLVQVARDERNPKAAEAKGILQALLDENFGDDWARWQTEVDQFLKQYSD